MKTFKLFGRTSAALSALSLSLFVPMAAHADDTGGGATEASLAGVTGMADTILDFMVGPIATAAGAIAIAIVGYRWFSGRMEMGKAVATVAGIVLVIGSVQIVSFIRAGTGIAEAESSLRSIEVPADVTATRLLFSEQV